MNFVSIPIRMLKYHVAHQETVQWSRAVQPDSGSLSPSPSRSLFGFRYHGANPIAFLTFLGSRISQTVY